MRRRGPNPANQGAYSGAPGVQRGGDGCAVVQRAQRPVANGESIDQSAVHALCDSRGKAAGLWRRLLQTVATHQAPRDDATTYAVTRATALLATGNLNAGLSMLEYAHRGAPSDGAIGLAIGLTRHELGDPRAADSLERLTRRSEWRDLWMALILVRLRFADTEQAAVGLQEMLSRIAVPGSEFDIELATMVSRLMDADGWCGLDNTGRLTVGAEQKSLRNLTILLDGREIPGGELRQVEGARYLRLPRNWRNAARLDVHLHGRPLIGSPLDITRITRVEGFVEADAILSGIRGWCRFPAERERVPAITITSLADPRKRMSVRAGSVESRFTGGDEFAIRHIFAVGACTTDSLGDAIRIDGPHGHALYGSPIWDRTPRESARAAMVSVAQRFPRATDGRRALAPLLPREIPAPVAWAVPRSVRTATGPRQSRPVDIVIPVYQGRDATLACIASVHANLPRQGERIIVIADGSPDRELLAALTALAGQSEITLHVDAVNRGYPGAANIGIHMAAGHDVILLQRRYNRHAWLDYLGFAAAVHSAPDIGTATPLSNDATIFSYPRRDGPNPCPDAAAAADIAMHVAKVNRGEVIEVPTGSGFCLYIRSECLEETGLLREDLLLRDMAKTMISACAPATWAGATLPCLACSSPITVPGRSMLRAKTSPSAIDGP